MNQLDDRLPPWVRELLRLKAEAQELKQQSGGDD